MLEKHQCEGQRVKSRTQWIKNSDSCTKEFFHAARPHSGASNIAELEDSQGILQSDQASLENICSKFYKDLYTAIPRIERNEEAAAAALSLLGDRLSREE